jgi:hypothetical protein
MASCATPTISRTFPSGRVARDQPLVTNPAATLERIGGLGDERAITTLALVLRRQGQPVDPFTIDQHRAQLREALAQPEITTQVQPIPGTEDGDLARTALTHLARPPTGALIDRRRRAPRRLLRCPVVHGPRPG